MLQLPDLLGVLIPLRSSAARRSRIAGVLCVHKALLDQFEEPGDSRRHRVVVAKVRDLRLGSSIPTV